MTKTLIVYYSRTGFTKQAAEQLAGLLGADLEALADTKDRAGALGYLVAGKDAGLKRPTVLAPLAHDPAAYDLVVLATPVWSWSITPAIRTYAAAQRAKLKKVAFLATRGGEGSEAIFKELADLCGQEPVASLALLTREVATGSAASKIKELAQKLS